MRRTVAALVVALMAGIVSADEVAAPTPTKAPVYVNIPGPVFQLWLDEVKGGKLSCECANAVAWYLLVLGSKDLGNEQGQAFEAMSKICKPAIIEGAVK